MQNHASILANISRSRRSNTFTNSSFYYKKIDSHFQGVVKLKRYPFYIWKSYLRKLELNESPGEADRAEWHVAVFWNLWALNDPFGLFLKALAIIHRLCGI